MLEGVYLVRHGETEWARVGRHTGRTDIELTAQGERDARQLGISLAGRQFDHVFMSPLKRARHTCELAGFGSQAHVMDDLLEWDYGTYEGITSVQIREQRPDWDLFRDGAPGGESVADISARADRAWAALKPLTGTAILFSSGHILRVLSARWLGCEASFARYLALAPASLSILGYEHGHSDAVIRLWNETRASGT